MFKIGTFADWFGVGLLEGIRESERCGAQGVQIYAWNELNSLTASTSQISEISKVSKESHQKITALCGELGGHGFEILSDNAKKVEYIKRTVDMALSLDCNIVTTHIGRIPEDQDSEIWKVMQAACADVGKYAEQRGAFIAVETGPEPVSRLKAFIDSCGTKGMAINYDPANLVMVTRDDEVNGVYTAGDTIVHTHAKDGICNSYVGPDIIYGIFADGGIEALNSVSTYFIETPLGRGHVRWIPYLKALKETGYKGYLTIEREVGKDAGADIRMAVGFLTEIMGKVF